MDPPTATALVRARYVRVGGATTVGMTRHKYTRPVLVSRWESFPLGWMITEAMEGVLPWYLHNL